MKYQKEVAQFYPESRVVTSYSPYGEAEAIYFQKTLNFPFHLYSTGISTPQTNDRNVYNNFPIAHLEYVVSGKGYIEIKDKTFYLLFFKKVTSIHKFHFIPGF